MLDKNDMKIWLRREVDRTHYLRKALYGRHQRIFGEPKEEERHLRARNRSQINFSNGHGRARWIREIGGQLFELLGAKSPDFHASLPVYFLTISDKRHAWLLEDERDEGRPVNIPLDHIRFHFDENLRGLDFIGMIDVAPYVSAGRVLGYKHVFHLHLHILVWNRTRKQMKRLCRKLNCNLKSLQPDAVAAHWQGVKANDLRQVLWYCFKNTPKQYQMWRKLSGEHVQKKRRISGVNAVRVHALMRDFTLDQLTVGSGAGRSIIRRAQLEVSRWRENARRRGVVLRCPPKDPPRKAVSE